MLSGKILKQVLNYTHMMLVLGKMTKPQEIWLQFINNQHVWEVDLTMLWEAAVLDLVEIKSIKSLAMQQRNSGFRM